MSTNYYRKPTSQEIAKAREELIKGIQLMSPEEFFQRKNIWEDIYNSPIHPGKSSCGWKLELP